MDFYSTPQAAKKLGVGLMTLNRYIAAKKIPVPPVRIAGVRVRLWTEDDIQRVREVLSTIANGRKTRYKKTQSATSSPGKHGTGQQSAKAKGKTKSKKKK